MTPEIEGVTGAGQRTITSVKLTDLFNSSTCDCIEDPVEAAIEAGHVRRQFHPAEPLAILNYTEACAYEGAWTPVTLACRGLIYRTDTGEVVARPFAKFFNYGQTGAPDLDLHAPALVTDKADGSLGILYPLPSGGWAVATRGSFTSEQALHATELFNRVYADRFTPRPEQTVLFEIVFPENRIVLDYAGLDDLILLGAVETATGAVLDPSWVSDWPGPVTTTFAAGTLAEALAMKPRANAEGVVVRLLDSGAMVKLKQADYVALHKIVTGLTARVVWQHLIEGKPLDELVAPLPDEFHPWCREVAADIQAVVDQQTAEIEKAYAEIVASLPEGFTRKDFAAVAVSHPEKWAMFLLLDGRDIRPELWKRAKPEPYLTPSGRTYGEDTA
ncbi:2'-5' RNA ligase [Micromonospora sp. CPCC 205371]|nr:2'-5' RNA ligase [Micromonospora sp. CPCC 205371]